MFVLGLTGSIGMGKSTTAAMFRDEGVPVYDADATVHALYGAEAVPLIEANFPDTTENGHVDRVKLAMALGNDADGFRRLEAIVHPLVREKERAFRDQAERNGADIILLDIPLLFETGGEQRVDAVVVVTCDAQIQRERVLGRPGMTAKKLETILARQLSDAEKRLRADYIVDTGLGLDHARTKVRAILAEVRSRIGK